MPAVGPFQVTLRRAVGQHEPARRVGAVLVDNVRSGRSRSSSTCDIFSERPTVTASPGAAHPGLAISHLDLVRRRTQLPCGITVGFVTDHALGEHAVERLLDADRARCFFMARVKKRDREDAGSRARCRRCTGPPAASSPLRARSNGVSARGEQNRAKYQDKSMKVSKVSVSRRAAVPHFGQVAWLPGRVMGERRLPGLSKVTSSGSTTGRSALGTGTMPQSSQWMIGIGQPQ